MGKRNQRTCIAREPLLYGSRPCTEHVGDNHVSDLCPKHRALIAPHQIINGVFYVAREEDEYTPPVSKEISDCNCPNKAHPRGLLHAPHCPMRRTGCGATTPFCNGYDWTCTEPPGHTGEHVASDGRKIVARWENPAGKGDGQHEVCKYCKCEMDLDVCWCGDGAKEHGSIMDAGHSFVPAGCRCGFLGGKGGTDSEPARERREGSGDV